MQAWLRPAPPSAAFNVHSRPLGRDTDRFLKKRFGARLNSGASSQDSIPNFRSSDLACRMRRWFARITQDVEESLSRDRVLVASQFHALHVPLVE